MIFMLHRKFAFCNHGSCSCCLGDLYFIAMFYARDVDHLQIVIRGHMLVNLCAGLKNSCDKSSVLIASITLIMIVCYIT